MRTSDPGQGGLTRGLLLFAALWLASCVAVLASVVALAAAGNEIVYHAKIEELPLWCLYAGDAMRRLSDLIAVNLHEVQRDLSPQGQALVGFASVAAWGLAVALGIRAVAQRRGVRASQLARWTLLVAALMFALLFMGSSAYSAWSSGRNPTYQGSWSNRSFTHACFALAAVALGAAAFVAIRSPPRVRAALALAVAAVLCFILPSAREFVARDRCLDSGGAFDAATFNCKR